MKQVNRGREPWSKEAVWRKLNAFCNVTSIQKYLNRKDKNEKDIMFAVKTARSFLLKDNDDLATTLIENYYGCFWIISAIVMMKNETITLKEISNASSGGHGLTLDYKNAADEPLKWTIFIQQNGFMGLILKNTPFKHDLDKVCLPSGIGKKQIESDYNKYKGFGFGIDDLISRIPELEWHYELLTGKPCPIACVHPGSLGLMHASKLASIDYLKEVFPHIRNVQIDEKHSDRQSYNSYKIEICVDDKIADAQQIPIFYSSLLTEANTIAKLDKPLDDYLLWNVLICYAWSIIARYTPHYLQRIESGDLSDWKPFLDEYSWFTKILMSTACLNNLTASEWRFSPPALFGG